MRRPQRRLNLFATLAAFAASSLLAVSARADGPEFFEKKIRPILVENCYKCHSHEAEKIKGGLALDSKAGLLKGGDNGPVIIAGDPDRSPLVKAVRYTDPDLQMPPKNKKLLDAQIADLEAWVKMGAPDPREEGKAPVVSKMEAARKHWAFQPIQNPPIPPVAGKSWAKTPIDNFILAKLEASQVAPAPSADRRTMIRRLTFDLTGLPPTFEEVEAFVNDKSPDAYAKVVDRLLASPRYGERWGRYWLDVSRFADTKGYVYADREEKRFVGSYAYRDWVINALNNDMPYDQFLKYQLAADQIPDADRDSLAALGFLTLGRRFLGVAHDIIDDRIDTVTRGMQGLTVSCARCHDHKFDPIPTADYYSLYGVFAATTERTVELGSGTQTAKEYLDYETELNRRTDAFRKQFELRRNEQSDRLRGRVTDYLVQTLDISKVPTEAFYTFVGEEDINPVVVRRWYTYLLESGKNGNPVWQLWTAFSKIPATDFAAKAPEVIAASSKGKKKSTPLVTAAFEEKPPASMRDVAETYGRLFANVEKKWREATDKKKALTKDEDALHDILHASDSPSIVPAGAMAEMEWYLSEPVRVELGKLQRQVEAWMIQSPGAPPHAVILEDRIAPPNPHVLRRGNPANIGEEVPRQFLEIVAGPDRKPFAKGSGRLELAEAIANKDNPLTARVMVNRIWQHHFGAGLVRTPSDFGTRCEPPSHPELLDWLAHQFMSDGWSLKKLHRLIVLSAVYQQSSDTEIAVTPAVVEKLGSHSDDTKVAPPAPLDPENRLLSHFNRQRLDFEALRDSLLFTSGELDSRFGGPAAEMFTAPYMKRRSVYGYLDRQFLPGTLRVFDFANPDMHSPQRSETTVPQQALFFMNGPFVVECAKALAALPKGEPEQKIRQLYHHVFQREPTAAQIQIGQQFIQAASAPKPPEADVKPAAQDWKYGFGEFDREEKALKKFQPLPYFSGDAWQGGINWPDKKLGWLQLTPYGGHPGDDLKHAVVRRWISPVTGAVSIEGVLKHDRIEGHGIRAYVISSRHGLLESWTIHNQNVDVKMENVAVEPGDSIDFIVSINESLSSNDFAWAPILKMVGPKAIRDSNGYAKEWDARKEFAGPPSPRDKPLTPWEQYAQALLSANEFLFVD